jgi:hypothetical protein
VSSDARGWRIALIPDTVLNPPQQVVGTLPDVLRVLETNGYGVLHLPPAGAHRLLLAVIADQVAEYAHHGYAVVAIGVRAAPDNGLHWRRLAPLLRRRGVPPPPRHLIDPNRDIAVESRRLSSFLAGYDLPQAEQRRWRV